MKAFVQQFNDRGFEVVLTPETLAEENQLLRLTLHSKKQPPMISSHVFDDHPYTSIFFLSVREEFRDAITNGVEPK